MKSLFLLCLFFTLACGESSETSSNGETSIDPLEEYHRRPLETTQYEEVSFKRSRQMTVRYDCQGQVTSQGHETISSISKKMTVDYENRKKAWTYDVYNRTTKSGNRGAFVSEGKFVIDYSPTVFNMRVYEGKNLVEYVFNRCTKIEVNPQGNKICTGELEVEKEGIFEITVFYSEEVIPGVREIYPSPESCRE